MDIKVVRLSKPAKFLELDIQELHAVVVHIIDLTNDHIAWLCSSPVGPPPFWGLAEQSRADRLAVISVCCLDRVLHVLVPKAPIGIRRVNAPIISRVLMHRKKARKNMGVYD